MIRFLLDTNVVSARAPLAVPDAQIASWLDLNADAVAISVVTIAEIESGIRKLEREHKSQKAARFAAWLEDLERTFGSRVLPFDSPAGRVTGALQDRARSIGRDPGFADLAIAGTAMRHDLALATRNGRHFDFLGVEIVNPFTSAEPP